MDQVDAVLDFGCDAVQERRRNDLQVVPRQGAHLQTAIGQSQVLQQ